MSAEHFVLLRYNRQLYTDNPYKIEDPDEYMRKRFPLFLRCVASLDNQTCDWFKVIVSLDKNTPAKFLEPILEEIEKRRWMACYTHHAIFLRKQVELTEDTLITSRLDNDDEYYPEFIETIQNESIGYRGVLDVGFERCKKECRHYNISRPASPFISLVEPTKDFKTVLSGEHSTLYKKYGGKKINRILAKQHIHGSNAYFERKR